MDKSQKDQELNYVKIYQIFLLSDISAALINLPVGAEGKKITREVGENGLCTRRIHKLFV
jgi:hypothetical protein